jgi:hypothetical protein
VSVRTTGPALVVVALAAGGLLLASTTRGAPAPDDRDRGLVVFEVYDTRGQRLDWEQFRQLQTAGRGEDGVSDVLVDPSTLQVREPWPLHDVAGDPAVEHPGGAVALALPWPSSAGYSQLVLELPPPGRWVFTTLAADQAVAEFGRQRAARPDHDPSPEFARLHGTAVDLLTQARAAASRRDEGALAARAYDAAVQAQLLFAQEYGLQYAARHRVTHRPAWGVTFDQIRPGGEDVASVHDLLSADPRDGWIRLVLDADAAPADYAGTVRHAHARGLRVLGELLDSSESADLDLAAWRDRVREYVRALPDVDAWEVGNEVNGDWVGPDAAAKAGFAARYVKEHTAARTLLTLYWQMGEAEPESSTFTWAAQHLTPEVLQHVDDLGLSVYPGEHPLGAALDRVVATLHRTFPDQRIAITELGYGSPDLDGTWWWGDPDDVTSAQVAVARYYQSAVLG